MSTAPRTRLAACLSVLAVALPPPIVALWVLFAPPADGPVAAVFPPWWSDVHAIASASLAGAVMRLGAAPFVVIVAAGDRVSLRRHGAWLLLDPRAAGGCAP